MTIKHLLIVTSLLLSVSAFAQNDGGDSKFSTVTITTSAVCEMCVATIEKGYKFEKGVRESKVDLESQTVMVTYKKGKTDPESLKEALTKMGYSADEMSPNAKAYDALHHCCKADDHGAD